MRGIGGAFLLFAAAAAPVGAQPAPPPADSPLACLFVDVAAGQRALAAPAALQRLSGAPEDGEQRGGAALDAILAALPRCAERGRWNESQREMAHLYVMTQLGREEMLRHYAAQNVDLTFIDGMVAAATPDSPPPFEEMAARVRAQGVTGERTDSAEDIAYLYLELMARAEAILAGFAEIGRAPR